MTDSELAIVNYWHCVSNSILWFSSGWYIYACGPCWPRAISGGSQWASDCQLLVLSHMKFVVARYMAVALSDSILWLSSGWNEVPVGPELSLVAASVLVSVNYWDGVTYVWSHL